MPPNSNQDCITLVHTLQLDWVGKRQCIFSSEYTDSGLDSPHSSFDRMRGLKHELSLVPANDAGLGIIVCNHVHTLI